MKRSLLVGRSADGGPLWRSVVVVVVVEGERDYTSRIFAGSARRSSTAARPRSATQQALPSKRYPAARRCGWWSEQRLGWLSSKCRAILVCYEKKAKNYLGFIKKVWPASPALVPPAVSIVCPF